jgi:hypothetical protein
MLIENKFVFVAIPKCATMSFEDACLKNNFTIDYSPYELFNRGMLNGIKPTSHVHVPIIKLREIHKHNYPFVTIVREEIGRFVSAWKHILKIIKHIDVEFYDVLKNVGNDEFCYHFGNHFKNLKLTKESVVQFLNQFSNKKNHEKYVIDIFISVFTPMVEWTNNDTTLIKFSFEDEIPQFERWVSEKCGVDFKLSYINDTNGIETKLVKDDFLINFYQTILNPTSQHKKELSFI